MSVSDLLSSTVTGRKPWTNLSVNSITTGSFTASAIVADSVTTGALTSQTTPVVPIYEAELKTTTPVSILTSTVTTLIFPAPSVISGFTYNASTGELTCTYAGKYLASAQAEIAGVPASGGLKQLYVLKNGVMFASSMVTTAIAANTLASCILSCSRPVRLAVGDIVIAQVAQTSGVSANSPFSGFNSLDLVFQHL